MTSYDSAFTRPPAPPPLDLVQAFLNSVDLEDGVEELATTTSLSAWIAERIPGLAGLRLTDADRLRFIRFREALRDVLEHGTGSEAARDLQREMDGIPLILRIDTGSTLELAARGEGIEAVIARIMAGVYHGMIDESWDRLKICRNDACRWAFYDASKNHSGVWCSMATCGSKAKARAYRSRAQKRDAS